MVDQEYGFPGIPEYPPAGHEFVPPKVTDNTGKKKRKLFGFNKDTLLMSLLAATVSVSMLTGSGVNAQEEPEPPVSVVIDSMVDLSEPVQTGDNTVADISDKVAVDVIPVSDDHRDAGLDRTDPDDSTDFDEPDDDEPAIVSVSSNDEPKTPDVSENDKPPVAPGEEPVKPAVKPHVRCPKCTGTGIYCPGDPNYGHDRGNADGYEGCHGTGKTHCPNGWCVNGRETCHTCGGTGTVPCWGCHGTLLDHGYPCQHCNPPGSGRDYCEVCGGKGWVECHCHGAEWIDCLVADKHVTCDLCNGTGYLSDPDVSPDADILIDTTE